MIELLSLDEIRARFGAATPRRQFLLGRLQALVNHLRATSGVKHVYLFGSFVSGKASPNDVDLFIVMAAGFTTAHLAGRALEPFQHDLCKIHYHADMFWVTEAIGDERINDLLEVFSRNREKQQQPIIEVKI